jgi:hypothetical protein
VFRMSVYCDWRSKADTIAPLLVEASRDSAARFLDWLSDEGVSEGHDTLLVSMSVQTTLLSLHLADRLVLMHLGAPAQREFMDALLPATKRLLGPILGPMYDLSFQELSFQELYNASQEFYASFPKLVPDKNESVKGTLFWEFGKTVAAAYAEDNPAAVMMASHVGVELLKYTDQALRSAQVIGVTAEQVNLCTGEPHSTSTRIYGKGDWAYWTAAIVMMPVGMLLCLLAAQWLLHLRNLTVVFLLIAAVSGYWGRKVGWALSKRVLYAAPFGFAIPLCVGWGIMIAVAVFGLICWLSPGLILRIIMGYALGGYISIPNFGLFIEGTIPPDVQPRHVMISALPFGIYILAMIALSLFAG